MNPTFLSGNFDKTCRIEEVKLRSRSGGGIYCSGKTSTTVMIFEGKTIMGKTIINATAE